MSNNKANSKKGILNLPVEVKLDILKFLKFNQLLSVQQTNYHFYCLIRQNERILSCRGLYSVEIFGSNLNELAIKCYYSIFNIESGIFNIPLDNRLMKKWQSAVDRQIPVYLSTCDTPPNNKLYTRVDMRYWGAYILKLPIYPQDIEEMKIVRCWLEKLFLCTYEHAEFEKYFYNPEMIKILFENEENIPTQFRADECTLTFCKHNIENLLKFNLDHLIITHGLTINLKFFEEQEMCNKYLLELLLNGGKNIHSLWIRGLKQQTLFDLFIKKIETSKDCSNIISEILFGFCFVPTLNLDHLRTEKIPDIKYKLENIYNTKMIFGIFCYDFNGYDNTGVKKIFYK
uniref:F-box domain-containing protein n=1 Tax=Meloidogyne enterolobii TaxID=390850 RepID=A0A6V7UQ93_MELEN|nr:unnamed protein product [Meloidogyne enterolobii]